MEHFKNQFLYDDQDDKDIDVLHDVAKEKKGSLKYFVDATKALCRKIQNCFEDGDSILNNG